MKESNPSTLLIGLLESKKYDKSIICMSRQYLYFSEQTVNGYTVGFKIAA